MINKYFIEIKNRILLLLLNWISIFFTCYYYKKILLFFLLKPVIISSKIKHTYFIFTNITEVFTTYIKLSFFISNNFILIILIYHIFIFFSPGLYKFEYKNYKLIIFIGTFLWFLSILLLYYFILPYSWNFFLSFQNNDSSNLFNLYLEAKLLEYLDLFFLCFFFCKINSQLLFFIFLFFYFNNNLKFFKIYRKFLYVIFFFISSLITPPDIISQLFLGTLTILLYELLTFTIILIKTKKKLINKATN